jgi:hypothetical protein
MPRDCGDGSDAESSTAPHRKWVKTPIGFDASDCPKSMIGTGQLPLLVSPTISNVKLYHVLIDGGAFLNLISLAAFNVTPSVSNPHDYVNHIFRRP